jgi:hypothetical protein
LGYESVEDIVGSMAMLKRITIKIIWCLGFSGSDGCRNCCQSTPDLVQTENLVVDRLILESPLSNIYETSKVASDEMGIPEFIFDMSFNNLIMKLIFQT